MKTRHILLILICVILVAGCAARNRTDGGEENDQPEEIQETLEVTLYFSDNQAMYVVPEVRELTVPKDASREEIIASVVGLLEEGPKQEGHFPTIPEGTKVRSVEIEEDTVTVDFSKELSGAHGATGEAMALNSLVNTLTEFDYIEKVFFTIEGEVRPLEHFVPDEPLTRNEDVIKK
ncbi:MAG: GerMN domain-containing protein [Bacillota bacterium]|jgi:germination protein M|nr:GerMN domain-containing protein [Bacillota bacterium]